MDTHPEVVKRFLKYVQVDTRSDNNANTQPSSPGQLELGRIIKQELLGIGVDPNCLKEFKDGSFAVVIPASPGLESQLHLAFAAHLDTYFNFPGGASPIVHESYSGGDIILPNNNIKIEAADLLSFIGKSIITADGTTLLGGDDKAGVASLVTTIESLLVQETPHGRLTFWFCVDEEIGRLDVGALPSELVNSWDVLWTVDGEMVGSVDIGSFVCRKLEITFTGRDAHPGVGGKNLKPAHYAAVLFTAKTYEDWPRPMETNGNETFIYITNISGNPSEAKLTCMPRTFDHEESKELAFRMTKLANECAQEIGVVVEVKDTLLTVNTRAAIDNHPLLIGPGLAAHREFCVTEEQCDVRGGTDGGMINMTYPNLPAPNMGTGTRNLHGPQEFVVMEELAMVPQILERMITLYSTEVKPK